MGKPVLLGPYTYNFAAATEQAVAKCAAWRVADAAELSAALQRLFSNVEVRQSMGLAALKFAGSACGASQRIADLAGRYLAARA